mmetsp:Transcript_1892/g.5662  ORF Transcript_1892/g.5662 Transcript_1892/m.5662 type:complete len:212 (-) Transcript_1892:293-928(-)
MSRPKSWRPSSRSASSSASRRWKSALANSSSNLGFWGRSRGPAMTRLSCSSPRTAMSNRYGCSRSRGQALTLCHSVSPSRPATTSSSGPWTTLESRQLSPRSSATPRCWGPRSGWTCRHLRGLRPRLALHSSPSQAAAVVSDNSTSMAVRSRHRNGRCPGPPLLRLLRRAPAQMRAARMARLRRPWPGTTTTSALPSLALPASTTLSGESC